MARLWLRHQAGADGGTESMTVPRRDTLGVMIINSYFGGLSLKCVWIISQVDLSEELY